MVGCNSTGPWGLCRWQGSHFEKKRQPAPCMQQRRMLRLRRGRRGQGEPSRAPWPGLLHTLLHTAYNIGCHTEEPPLCQP